MNFLEELFEELAF